MVALSPAPWGEADCCSSPRAVAGSGRATFVPEPDSSPRRRAEGTEVPRFTLPGHSPGTHHRITNSGFRTGRHAAPHGGGFASDGSSSRHSPLFRC